MTLKRFSDYDDLTYRIIGSAMNVHRSLGPGFPEAVYHRALAIALQKAGLGAESEKPMEVIYDGQSVGQGFVDLLAEDAIPVELKAIETLLPTHEAPAISYLAALGREVGLLINFGTAKLEYPRIIPPFSVQRGQAYQARVEAWKSQRQLSRNADQTDGR
jgi:GxxExxY protein